MLVLFVLPSSKHSRKVNTKDTACACSVSLNFTAHCFRFISDSRQNFSKASSISGSISSSSKSLQKYFKEIV